MAAGYRLKGHESFYLREGWLTKGLRAVEADPHVFSKNSGADALGVGTNMAKAIRYWLKTANLISETNRGGAVLSSIGRIIYENDPYFEDVFSLWVVHINIVLNATLATSWSIFFNQFDLSAFKREELNDAMKSLLIDYTGDPKLSDRSIRDDCSAIVSMYLKTRETNIDPEDKKVSPFAVLGLLGQNGIQLYKEQPNQSIVDPLLILYIIREQLVADQVLSIDDIIDKPNMPGKVLNLSRLVCNEYLDDLANGEYITVNRTAGLDVVYPQNIVNVSKEETLLMHYKNESKKHLLFEQGAF